MRGEQLEATVGQGSDLQSGQTLVVNMDTPINWVIVSDNVEPSRHGTPVYLVSRK